MNKMTQQQTTNKLQGIQRYYTRTIQGEHANTYYIEPRETCPMYILNSDDRFVVLAFDRDDNYIVVDDKRYYLSKESPWLILTSCKSRKLIHILVSFRIVTRRRSNRSTNCAILQ